MTLIVVFFWPIIMMTNMYNCTGKGVLNIRMTMVLIMMMMLTGFVGSRCSQIVEAMITRGLLIRWTIPFWKYFQNIFRIEQILDLLKIFLLIIVTVHSRFPKQHKSGQKYLLPEPEYQLWWSVHQLFPVHAALSQPLSATQPLSLEKKWFKCNQILCT